MVQLKLSERKET